MKILPKSSALFISGTGTDVGKTVVCAALATGFSKLQRAVAYWKPVQCGADVVDAATMEVIGGDRLRLLPSAFFFKTPASPDQAARAEKQPYATVKALRDYLGTLATSELLLIEGAGGLEVPLNEQPETWIDFLAATRLPAVVVAQTGLGTLNHTTLSVRALQRRAIPVLAIVMNGEPHAENVRSLTTMFPQIPILPFPLLAGTSEHPQWLAASTALAAALGDVLSGATGGDYSVWQQADRQHVWHPYTQHRTADEPLQLIGAQGVWLEAANGQRLLDGTSSWWVNTIGHGRREVGDAIATQQQRLDHVIFAGATHEPGARLAEKLAQLSGFDKVFYSDNGSTAVEIALKIAYQSWTNAGDCSRHKFLTFRGSYHGDTFGAMAVADSAGFHGAFAPLLFKNHLLTIPTNHRSAASDGSPEDFAGRCQELSTFLARHHHELAGVITEPLVQGAGGMLMHDPRWLTVLSGACRQYGLPLIFDEVFTGLGRVGDSFAYARAGVEPDIICIAKGLTGGNLPLAATLTSGRFFEKFMHPEKAKALLHGHSYAGNPIACAAGLAALEILEDENLAGRSRWLEDEFKKWFAENTAALALENPRCLGGIMACELPGSKVGDYFHAQASRVTAAAMKYDLYLRPLGNTLYFIPPLVIDDSELASALDGIKRTVEDLQIKS